ncbi:hypothetical protein CYMTET_14860 [Cymbomonas tetramitiformis]|uniref:Uncharacterized protein n=1 Tax=Cymbomonas tetramitiformis TaxID=36881 RepID=A0AAE0GF80_9CHLO|nr:hypothetical protein CYMTET_14860 [Cymbomonas tetramitiformis]
MEVATKPAILKLMKVQRDGVVVLEDSTRLREKSTVQNIASCHLQVKYQYDCSATIHGKHLWSSNPILLQTLIPSASPPPAQRRMPSHEHLFGDWEGERGQSKARLVGAKYPPGRAAKGSSSKAPGKGRPSKVAQMIEIVHERAELRKAEASAIATASAEAEAQRLAAMQTENDKQRAHELSFIHILASAMADQAPPPLPTPTPAVATNVATPTAPPEDVGNENVSN